MIRNLPLLVLGAAALAACNPNSDPIVANEAPDPMASELANAAPVELPPAIVATKSYRCKDNSVVKIDWLADKTAYVNSEGMTQTHLTVPVPEEGKPAGTELSAEGGYALAGEATATSISVTLPGKGKQTCHV